MMTIRTRSFHDRAGRILADAGAVQPDPVDETVWALDGDKILPCTLALDRAGCNWTKTTLKD